MTSAFSFLNCEELFIQFLKYLSPSLTLLQSNLRSFSLIMFYRIYWICRIPVLVILKVKIQLSEFSLDILKSDKLDQMLPNLVLILSLSIRPSQEVVVLPRIHSRLQTSRIRSHLCAFYPFLFPTRSGSELLLTKFTNEGSEAYDLFKYRRPCRDRIESWVFDTCEYFKMFINYGEILNLNSWLKIKAALP